MNCFVAWLKIDCVVKVVCTRSRKGDVRESSTKKNKTDLIFLGRLASSKTTGSSSGDETDLTTVRCITTHCGRFADVLMVTTTMWMLNRIHGHTTHLRPAVSLCFVFVIRATSFQHWFVNTTTTSDQADHGTIARSDHFLRAGGQPDTSAIRIRIVSNHGGVISARARQLAAISHFLFDVADDGTFWHATDWQHVADLQTSTLTAMQRLASVHSFGCDEQFFAQAILIWIAKSDNRQRSSTAGIVNDFLERKGRLTRKRH